MAEDQKKLKRKLAKARASEYLEPEAEKTNPVISTLTQVSDQFKQMKFEQLQQQRRDNGFNQFLFDLKDPSHNTTGAGWSLTNGMLHVDYTAFKNETTKTQMHEFLNAKLGENVWYERPNDSSKPGNPFGIDIKTLGKNGVNAAVDPIILVQDELGKVSVLSGQRPVCNEYCLPGGMNESTVIKTCVAELLEECFSGALFEPEEASSALLDANVSSVAELNAFITNICPAELKDSISALSSTDVSASQMTQHALAHIQTSRLDEGKKGMLIAKIKCKLYEAYLNEQYTKFSGFISENINQTQATVFNGSDPRNTDAAYMETKPLPGFLDKQTFIAYVTNECALNFKAGDDLGNVKLRDIDVFCGSIASTGTESTSEQQGTYSDHASLVLNAITLGLETNHLQLTDALSQQIETIVDNHPSLDISQDEQETSRLRMSI